MKPFFPTLALFLGFLTHASAADAFWDINGITPGAGGTTPGGTWSTGSAFWNSDPTGGGAGSITGWVNGNTAIFSAGSDATGSFTVTPDATVTTVEKIVSRSSADGSLITIETGTTLTNTTGIIEVEGTGRRLQIRSVLTGSNGLTKRGTGILELRNGIPTYTGDTEIEAGSLRIIQAGRIPTATLVNVHAGASFDLRANATIAGLSGAGLARAGASNTEVTLTLSAATGIRTFSGELDLPAATGKLHLVKNGNYEQRLTGSTGNTFSGDTTVHAGILALGKTPSVNAIANGTLTVAGSGLLRLDASHQIADTVAITLDGGTFSTHLSNAESVGTLLLESNSTLDLGTGAMSLSFAASQSLDWDGATLTISNFTLGIDTLRFGTDASGLSSDQLALLRFSDYGGVGATIDAFGYLAPVQVPEPSHLLLGGLAGLAILVSRRRQRSSR